VSPPPAIPAGAPARVRDRLRAAPDGALRVVHPGRHAVYLDLGGWCLGVVGSRAAAVPCALRVRLPELDVVGDGSAYVRGGVLHLDGTPLVVGRTVDVRAPRLDPARLAAAAPAFGGRDTDPATDPATDPVPAAVRAFVDAGWGAGPLDAAAVARLVGRGDGLTPLGDDVLCGWLAVHRAARRATPDVDACVRALLSRTTLLSATLLDCALHGEVLPEFAAYLAALGTGEEPARAAALAGIGHTSGAGLLHGARRALAGLADRPTRGSTRAPSPLTRGAA
jgi:uncharacterized protein DUF2877